MKRAVLMCAVLLALTGCSRDSLSASDAVKGVEAIVLSATSAIGAPESEENIEAAIGSCLAEIDDTVQASARLSRVAEVDDPLAAIAAAWLDDGLTVERHTLGDFTTITGRDGGDFVATAWLVPDTQDVIVLASSRCFSDS